MFKVTRYCIRPQKGDPAQFYQRDEALSAARRMVKRCGAVRVYEVTGWPAQDLWDRPRLVASYGEVSRPSRCA